MTDNTSKGWSRPGSWAARKDGCTCPVIDNHHGLGRGGNGNMYGWYQCEDCPLHGVRVKVRAR